MNAFEYLHRSLGDLSAAEDLLRHFDVEFDARIVRISRLHILQRFRQYLRAGSPVETANEDTLREHCRMHLARAYGDFVHSTPSQERVFKVFADMGAQSVPLEKVRAALPSCREA